jgi:hypothetical protein
VYALGRRLLDERAAEAVLALDGTGPAAARLRQLAGRALAWFAGMATLLVLVALAFTRRHALDDALFWGLWFNRRYLAASTGIAWSLRRLALQLGGVVAPSIALYATGIAGLVALVRGRSVGIRRAREFLSAWTALSIFAVGLGGRFFGHYFLQAEMPLALAAAPGFARLWSRARAPSALLLVAPALALVAIAAHPPLDRALFHGDDPDYDAIGRAVAATTAADDTIWVWGNVPQIYHAADRRPGVRFPFCNYLTGVSPATPSEYDPRVDPRADRVPGALDMALADLAARRPAVVVDTAEQGLKHYRRFPLVAFPPLSDFVARHYRRGETVAGAVLYHRID